MMLIPRLTALALVVAGPMVAQEVQGADQSQLLLRPASAEASPSKVSMVASLSAVRISLAFPSDALPPESLPDAPGIMLAELQSNMAQAALVPPCPVDTSDSASPETSSPQAARAPCPKPNPYRPFLSGSTPIPLAPRQKAYLAVHDVIDPFNLMTIGLNAAFTVGINSHNAYDPGLRGFAWDSLYSLSQDATGEFIGTFAVCSLLHEDPHYHRLTEGTAKQRFLHALSRTWVAQRDDGRMMPNYEKFITYPASAEISNLYVPGVAGNGPSTVERILIGLASDPIDNLITEFLPDFASRIHVHVLFVQQLINQVAAGQL